MEGRACFIVKDSGGEVDHTLAPNGERSKLYDDALRISGDRNKALNVWGTVYTDEYAKFVGNWMLNTTEYDLDENGEPKIDDVLSYLKRDIYEAGEFTREDVKDLNNTFISAGVDGLSALYDRLVDNFYIDGDIVLNASNLRSSGLYTEDEIYRILSNREVMDSVRDMMRRIVSYGSSELTMMTEKDARYLEPYNQGDFSVYADGYDALGKRRVENPMRVDADIAEAVGGITDRGEFEAAFESVPYPSIVERFNTDREFADEMYDRFSKFTRTTVANRDGVELTDSTGPMTDQYLTRDEALIDEAREDLSALIDMSDDDAANPSKVRELLKQAALSLSNVGIDISDLLTSPSVDIAGLRDLAASIDAVLADLSYRPDRVDITDMTERLDAMTGKGNVKTRVGRYGRQKGLLSVNAGKKYPAEMYESGMLEVGRGVYKRVRPIEDVDAVYGSMADLLIAHPDALPGVNLGDVSNVERDEVIRRLRRKVAGFTDAFNSERMVLTRMAMGLPLTVKREAPNEMRELQRYKAANGHNIDLLSGMIKFRKAWIREKINNSDLYRNALRFFSFGDGYTLRLERTDPITRMEIEMSIPDGEIRDFLMAYSASTADVSMRDLFFYPSDSTGFADIRFERKLRRNYPSMTRQITGPFTRNEDGTIEVRGAYDNFLADGEALYEKVGEKRFGSVYAYVDSMMFGDPSNITESSGGDTVSSGFHADPDSLYRIDGSSAVTLESNEYTRENDRLMREFTCG